MKFHQKYILPIFHLLIFLLLGFLLFDAAYYVLGAIHGYLASVFPDIFRVYSQISEAEEYEEQRKRMTVLIIGVILILVHYLALRVDNKRFEYVIDLTDGLYTMPEGLSLYLKRFTISDVIASALDPLLVTVPIYFIPEDFFERWLRLPFWCYDNLIGYFDIVEVSVYLVLLSLIARALVIYPTVKVWRAMWLTASVE